MFDDKENPQYPRQPGSAIDQRGLRRVIDGYDCGVLQTRWWGKFSTCCGSRGSMRTQLSLITSDHGGNLGELAIYAEHGTADNITCRIPFIIKWPGVKAALWTRACITAWTYCPQWPSFWVWDPGQLGWSKLRLCFVGGGGPGEGQLGTLSNGPCMPAFRPIWELPVHAHLS